MPPVAVYEVATFYTMYNLKPPGRFKITICTNLPCALQGATAAAEHLKQKLGIGFNETTADGKFTLKEGECMGACGDAPVLIVNDRRMCSWMSDAQARRAGGRADGGGRARRRQPGLRETAANERAVRIPGLRSRRHPDGGAHRQELAARGLRRARRLRRAEEDPQREDSARPGDRRGQELGAARARRRGLSDRPQVELHAAPVTSATSTSSAIRTRASRARSRTATSCATTRTR